MKDRAYDIMKELVELHDREKVLQDELKKIFKDEDDINVCIEYADNFNNTFDSVLEYTEELHRKERKEQNDDDPVFYDEGGVPAEKMLISELTPMKNFHQDFLDKLHTYGYNYIHDLRFDKEKHEWSAPGDVDFEVVYRNINGAGTKYDWYEFYRCLCFCRSILVIKYEFLNIDFVKNVSPASVNTFLDDEFCKNNGISKTTQNALWRAGYTRVADLELINDVKRFKKETRGIGPGGIKSLIDLGLL